MGNGCFLALFFNTNYIFLAPARGKFFIFSMEKERERSMKGRKSKGRRDIKDSREGIKHVWLCSNIIC